ncbi:MAG: hypothetical protein AB7I27_00385 [Bacteriovoracaceae bacterium]
MAFSATRINRTVDGNTVREIWSWNAASVTGGSFSCGLGTVMHISPNNNVTEDIGKWTSSGATVTVSGVTSNDTGTVEVVGR